MPEITEVEILGTTYGLADTVARSEKSVNLDNVHYYEADFTANTITINQGWLDTTNHLVYTR